MNQVPPALAGLIYLKLLPLDELVSMLDSQLCLPQEIMHDQAAELVFQTLNAYLWLGDLSHVQVISLCACSIGQLSCCRIQSKPTA